MVRSRSDHTTGGLRRLPKKPTSAPHSPRDAAPDRVQASIPAEPELYFEALPVPWAEAPPENHHEEPAASPPATEPEATEPPDDPSFYFRHSSATRSRYNQRDNTTTDADISSQAWPELPSWTAIARAQDPMYSRERTAAPSAADAITPADESALGADPAVAGKAKPSAKTPDAQLSSMGDPMPASGRRPSGVVRSRPGRPSGSFAVARQSGEHGVSRISSEMTKAGSSGETACLPRQASSPLESLRKQSQDSVSVVPLPGVRYGNSQEVKAIAAQTSKDEAVPSRGKGKALAGMMFASVALVAYAFQIGSLENSADAVARQWTSGSGTTTGAQLLASILPWLLVLPAVLLFGFIVWLLSGLIGLRRTSTRKNRQPKEKRPKTPLDQFKSAALRHGVDNRTAYRGWRLLEAACGGDRPFAVDSLLTDDLALTSREIRSVHLQLLKDLSRVSDPAMRLPPTETVLSLLQAVEAAPMARPSASSSEVPIPGDPGQRWRRDSETN